MARSGHERSTYGRVFVNGLDWPRTDRMDWPQAHLIQLCAHAVEHEDKEPRRMVDELDAVEAGLEGLGRVDDLVLGEELQKLFWLLALGLQNAGMHDDEWRWRGGVLARGRRTTRRSRSDVPM